MRLSESGDGFKRQFTSWNAYAYRPYVPHPQILFVTRRPNRLRFDRDVATNVEYRQREKVGAVEVLRYEIRWYYEERRNLIYTRRGYREISLVDHGKDDRGVFWIIRIVAVLDNASHTRSGRVGAEAVNPNGYLGLARQVRKRKLRLTVGFSILVSFGVKRENYLLAPKPELTLAKRFGTFLRHNG